MEMGKEHKETTEMAVTNIRRHDILLGTDWFRAHNPQIDWAKNKLHLDRCPTSCYPNYPNETSDLAHLLPTEDLEVHYDNLLESKYQGTDPIQCIIAHLHGEYEDMIQPSKSVVSPTMSPPKESIVVSQRNMAKHKSIVVSQCNMAKHKSIVASQRNMAKHELVITPTVLISQRTRLVVTSTVPPKNASRHTTQRYEPVVARTMVSTTLAKAKQPKNVEIPPEFR